MTDPDGGLAREIEALIAKWRKRGQELSVSSRLSDAGRCDALAECADELLALLRARSPRVQDMTGSAEPAGDAAVATGAESTATPTTLGRSQQPEQEQEQDGRSFHDRTSGKGWTLYGFKGCAIHTGDASTIVPAEHARELIEIHNRQVDELLSSSRPASVSPKDDKRNLTVDEVEAELEALAASVSPQPEEQK